MDLQNQVRYMRDRQGFYAPRVSSYQLYIPRVFRTTSGDSRCHTSHWHFPSGDDSLVTCRRSTNTEQRIPMSKGRLQFNWLQRRAHWPYCSSRVIRWNTSILGGHNRRLPETWSKSTSSSIETPAKISSQFEFSRQLGSGTTFIQNQGYRRFKYICSRYWRESSMHLVSASPRSLDDFYPLNYVPTYYCSALFYGRKLADSQLF